MKHMNITITGRVQRVGFRFTAMETAYRFSIRGFVINSGSNAVYIEAEGTNENLDRYIAWCNKGPLGSQVDQLEVQEGPMKGFTMFEIRNRT